jgi:hypothetical protein
VIVELVLGNSIRKRQDRRIYRDVFEEGRAEVTVSRMASLAGVEEETVIRISGTRTGRCGYDDYLRIREWLRKVERS